jgi:hypothetical protein
LSKLTQVKLVYHLKCKISKWLVHHLNQMTNQVQAIKCKCSNLLMLQEITLWIP